MLCAILSAASLASPVHAQVQRVINNGGFENNNPAGPGSPNYEIYPNANVTGWDSTSGDIELWDSGFSGVPAYAGNVFAELNANTPGALYQNICLINGEPIRWQFAHRNRSGGAATQRVTMSVANSSGVIQQSLQSSAVTSTTAWSLRSNTTGVTYTGATGFNRVQFLTSDSGSYGNFLDELRITLQPLVDFEAATTSAAEGTASPTLPSVRVTGFLASDVLVNVSVTGGTATLGTDYTTPSGTNTFTVTIPAGTYSQTRIALGVAILQDNIIDSGETISFSLTPTPAQYTIGSNTTCGAVATASATHTILDDQIEANNDSAGPLSGVAASTNVVNAFTNDVLEGAAVAAGNVTTTVITPATPISGGPVPALVTSSGNVNVPAGTPAGSYTIRYQICQTLQPANCAQANIVVTVSPSADLSVTKTNTPGVNGDVDQAADTVTFGTTVSYTITARNSGPDPVTGAVVTDTVGTRLNCPAANPVSISGSGVPAGSFTIANLTGPGITLGTLTAGQSAALTFSCQVN